MRSKLLSLLMVFLLLGSATPLAVAETAPARSAAAKISVTGLQYPQQVTAGEPFTLVVTAEAPTEGGLCCGWASLHGPENQVVQLLLYPDEAGTLTGTVTLSEYAQPGTWTIEYLRVRANTWQDLWLGKSATWTHTFTVEGSGSKVDTERPSLRSLEVPQKAIAGDAYAIRVKATDDLSGIDYAMVRVEPAKDMRYRRSADERAPKWSHYVKLLPDEATDELVGQMVMEESRNVYDGLEVTGLTLYDRAGNATILGPEGLAATGFSRRTELSRMAPPKELTTSTDLTVIHAGSLAYTHWLELDRDYLVEMVKRLAEDPAATREYLVAELSQLQVVLAEVRSEIYTDPASGLRFVPFATSGKWLVLNQAISERNRLLSLVAAGRLPKGEAEIEQLQWETRDNYAVTKRGEYFSLTYGGNSNDNRLAAAYIRILGRSPELAAALKSPAYQVYAETLVSELDRDLIYFVPLEVSQSPSKVRGWPMIWIPIDQPDSMADHLGLLFYQVGLHVGDALFSHQSDPDRSEWWAEYIALRGGQDWLDEAQTMESPASNLAADFAETFAPEGATYNRIRSYPALEGEQKAAFRELIQSRLKAVRSTPEPSVQGTKVGLADRHQVTLTPTPVNGSGLVQFLAYTDGRMAFEGVGSFARDRRSYTYTGRPQVMGDPVWHVLWTIDRDWRYQYYVTTYVRAPLLLDPVPAGTNKPVVNLTGTVLPGKVVSAGELSVKADQEGRFTLEVALQPGENEIRLRVAGTEMGARVRVTYEPEGTAVPIAWDIPEKVSRQWVEGEIRTVPFAVIRIDDRPLQLGANGMTFYGKALKPGENLIRLEVTDRYGNTTVLEKRVTVSE